MDIVRCAVIYDNIGELVVAMEKFLANYQVCRIKNNFSKHIQVVGNYRCVMINFIFQHPEMSDLKMICEVQMTLKQIFNIRKKMHKTYKVFRSILPEDSVIEF